MNFCVYTALAFRVKHMARAYDSRGRITGVSTSLPATLHQGSIALNSQDPWAYKELGAHLNTTTFLWHEPGECTFAAFGEAIVAPDLDAEALGQWCSKLCEQVSEEVLDGSLTREDALVFLSVMGFDTREVSRVTGEVWAGWSRGMTWVPRVLIRSRESGCEALVTGEANEIQHWLNKIKAFDAQRRPVDPPTPKRGYHTLDTCGERDAWTERVSALVDGMSSPDPTFSKVVLARAQQLEAAPGRRFDPLTTAWHLRRQQPECVSFAWQHEDGSTFIGATPELLCRLEGERLETTALAGTAPRGRSPGEDQALATTLAATTKERHEHQLVVEAILETLRELGAKITASRTPRIRQLHDVQHLETPIGGTLPKERTLLEAVSALHPTPAVGGVPRDAALTWLAQHEGLDRGHYAAPIGWFEGSGKGAMYVALRSVFLHADRAWAFAGAGIVADSKPESEWRETNHKLRAIRSALTTVEAKS